MSVQPNAGWTYTVTRATVPAPVKDDDGNEVTDHPLGGGVAGRGRHGGREAGRARGVPAVRRPDAGEGLAEPDHPAPTLQLAAATGTDAAITDAATASTAGSTAVSADGPSQGSVTGAYAVGGAGLLAGLAALGLALTRRRTAPPTAPTA